MLPLAFLICLTTLFLWSASGQPLQVHAVAQRRLPLGTLEVEGAVLAGGRRPAPSRSRPPERRGTGRVADRAHRSSRCWSPSGRGPHHACRRRRRRRSCRRGAPPARCGRRYTIRPTSEQPECTAAASEPSGIGATPQRNGRRQRRPSGRRPGSRSSRRPGRRPSRRQPGRALVEDRHGRILPKTADDHTSRGSAAALEEHEVVAVHDLALVRRARARAAASPRSCRPARGISSASKLTSPRATAHAVGAGQVDRVAGRRRSRSRRSARPPAATRGAR